MGTVIYKKYLEHTLKAFGINYHRVHGYPQNLNHLLGFRLLLLLWLHEGRDEIQFRILYFFNISKTNIPISIILRLPEILINNSSVHRHTNAFHRAKIKTFFHLSIFTFRKQNSGICHILNLRWYANSDSPFLVFGNWANSINNEGLLLSWEEKKE